MTTVPFRNHLLVTDAVSVHGLVPSMTGRLIDHLRHRPHPHIVVANARIRDLVTGDVTECAEALVGAESVVWAHEFLALSGDPAARRLTQAGDEVTIEILTNRPSGLKIRGTYRRGSLPDLAPYFAVAKPTATGSNPLAAAHAAEIARLDYVILCRAIAAVVAPTE